MLLAGARWAPDAVLTGRAAARLTYWPDLALPQATLSAPQLLRAANITGWRANLPVEFGSKVYFLDVGLKRLKIGIEIDGREVHKAENVQQFYTDRRKWTTLNLHGWLLLHFGANHISDESDWFLDCVREAIVSRRRLAG